MFRTAEDPQKSRWWDKAWETLVDSEFGPVIDLDTPDIEVALWLVTLRNIHAAYEATYWDHSYDPTWMDYWAATGESVKDLITYLDEQSFLEGGASQVVEGENHQIVCDALRTFCWGKRQVVFDAMMKRFEDENTLSMVMLGGKLSKSRGACERIFSFVYNEFSI